MAATSGTPVVRTPALRGMLLLGLWLAMTPLACQKRFAKIPDSPFITQLAEDSFDGFIREPGGLVMVDFHADWCGPCHQLAPTVARLASDFQGTLRVGKLDVDDAPGLTSRLGVEAIPELRFYRDGKLLARRTGVVPEAELREWITKFQRESTVRAHPQPMPLDPALLNRGD